MKSNLAHLVSEQNRQLPAFLAMLLITAMLVCVAATFQQIGQQISPGWQGGYLVFLTVLVCIEVFLAKRVYQTASTSTTEWLIWRATELVCLVVFIRIVVYLKNGPEQLILDLEAYRISFFSAFFNSETILTLFYCLFIWIMCGRFEEWFGELEHDPDQLDQERIGFGLRDRDQIRRNLVGLVFGLGGLVTLLSAGLHYYSTNARDPIFMIEVGEWNLVIYFILGLALVALSRFTALRSRWYIQMIPISPKMAGHWALFALLILLAVGLFASLLPTRYSVGFLELLASLISILASLITFLQWLVLAPLLYLMGLINTLFGSQLPAEPLIFPPVPPPVNSPASSAGWLDIVKSILFWGFLVFVVTFSITHYLRQRAGVLKELGGSTWIGRLLTWLGKLIISLLRINRGIQKAIHDGGKAITHFLDRKKRANQSSPSWWASQASTPRDQILATYAALLEYTAGKGIRRLNHQTPGEYASGVETTLPEIQPDLETLTRDFQEARYTRHPITQYLADQAQSSLEAIRQVLDHPFSPRTEDQDETS